MKKIIMSLLSLLLFFSLTACSVENAAAVSEKSVSKSVVSSPVELLSARGYKVRYDFPYVYIQVRGLIDVENLAYDKTVLVHYTTAKNSTNWNTVSAVYDAPNAGNFENGHLKLQK